MDPRFSPPADGGQPQNALTGQLFDVNSGTTDIAVPLPTASSGSGEIPGWLALGPVSRPPWIREWALSVTNGTLIRITGTGLPG